uniref:Uncharacterized protein n=1 Tax=Physcomitrium patens TaxID=3218 RepID=A0A2K1IRD6_PHYPA|nr:hypothetical protein PHYPA_025963 [Physcomitrium patens]
MLIRLSLKGLPYKLTSNTYFGFSTLKFNASIVAFAIFFKSFKSQVSIMKVVKDIHLKHCSYSLSTSKSVLFCM